MVVFSLMLVSSVRAQEASAAPPTNEAILHQMPGLQDQVKALRAEVSALKGAPALAATAPAPAEATPPAASAVTATSGTATLRSEYSDDNQQYATGTSQELSEFTATLQRTIAKSIISRLEFRRDMSDAAVFQKGVTSFIKTQNTVAPGLVYAFSSADK